MKTAKKTENTQTPQSYLISREDFTLLQLLESASRHGFTVVKFAPGFTGGENRGWVFITENSESRPDTNETQSYDVKIHRKKRVESVAE